MAPWGKGGRKGRKTSKSPPPSLRPSTVPTLENNRVSCALAATGRRNTTSTIEHNGLFFPFLVNVQCGAYPLLTDVLIASDNSRIQRVVVGFLFLFIHTTANGARRRAPVYNQGIVACGQAKQTHTPLQNTTLAPMLCKRRDRHT